MPSATTSARTRPDLATQQIAHDQEEAGQSGQEKGSLEVVHGGKDGLRTVAKQGVRHGIMTAMTEPKTPAPPEPAKAEPATPVPPPRSPRRSRRSAARPAPSRRATATGSSTAR